MQNEKSQEINIRFFTALEELKAKGTISTTKEFCEKHDIPYGNFARLKVYPAREFQLSFLTILVENYSVSADWLITGSGNIFRKK